VQRLELYYIINYYIKYVELLDTVFLALKKKPLGLFGCLAADALITHCPVSSFLARVPSLCDSLPLLHSTQWQDKHCNPRPCLLYHLV
jgi:hypothetical protein